MKRKLKVKTFFTLLLLCLFFTSAFSQKKVEVNGYANNMQSFMFSSFEKDNWISDNLLHNRINAAWYINNSFTLKAELRNRFLSGESIEFNPLTKDQYDFDPGWIDLTFNIAEGNSYLLNSTIDRLYLEFNYKDLNITAGRQRINWGKTYVWNPNDIFNTYSFFDVDYPERPGSDAIRIQYYTSFTSSIEAVAKMDHNKKLTAAGIVRFNALDFDFQVLGGVLAEQDIVAGIGWEGNLKSIGFKGESTLLQPKENFMDTSSLVLSSLSFDYMAPNSLFFQVEGLYRYSKEGLQNIDLNNLFANALNIKTMAFSEWNIFGQVSYPVSPIINIALSGMYFTDLKGFFTGPSITISLSDDSEFSFFTQYFNWEQNNSRSDLTLSYLRLKYSF